MNIFTIGEKQNAEQNAIFQGFKGLTDLFMTRGSFLNSHFYASPTHRVRLYTCFYNSECSIIRNYCSSICIRGYNYWTSLIYTYICIIMQG